MKNFLKICIRFILLMLQVVFYPVKILNNIIYGTSRPNIVGYAWYSKKEYPKIIQSSNDPLDEIVPTYDLWKTRANKFIHTYEGERMIIFKVTIEMEELENWLKDKGLLNTGENRQKYVNYRMRKFLKNAII